jgi:hypothetical protein
MQTAIYQSYGNDTRQRKTPAKLLGDARAVRLGLVRLQDDRGKLY